MKHQDNNKNLLNKYKKYLFWIGPFRKIIIKAGKGSFVEDFNGQKYLDMMSGQFCLALGHCNPVFNKLIIKQLSKIIHTNTLTLTEEILMASKKLAELTNYRLSKTLFLSTGAEAVEAALRYAKIFTKKEGIVAVDSGYHGLTLATQSISMGGKYAMPKVPSSVIIPTPDFIHNKNKHQNINDFVKKIIAKSYNILKKYKGKIAAFIIEPVISVGGMIFPPKKYFNDLLSIVKEHKALLIFDECQTSFGRTGTWFGYQNYDIIPDILVFSKIAGLGLPVSGIILKEEIAKEIEGKSVHFSSHQNDPLSGAIVSFVVEYIKKNNLLKKIKQKGDYLLKKLTKLSRKEKFIQNPRGLGLMLGFDLPPEIFKNGMINPGQELINILEKKGIMIQVIRQGKTVRILPNFLISYEEIDFFIKKLEEGIKELKRYYKKQLR